MESQKYILTLPGRPPLPATLEFDGNVTTLADLLPSLFKLTDRLVHQAIAESESAGVPVACSKGCDFCCSQLVPVSEHEAVVLAKHVQSLPDDRRTIISDRFEAIIARLKETVLFDHITNFYEYDVANHQRYRALQRDYFSLQMPCPFLEDNACSAYDVRPMACRQYLVSSNPDHCRSPFGDHAQTEEILLPADPGGALASFDGENVHATRAFPLSFTLLKSKDIHLPSLAIGPEEAFQRYLNLLSLYFANSD